VNQLESQQSGTIPLGNIQVVANGVAYSNADEAHDLGLVSRDFCEKNWGARAELGVREVRGFN